MSKLPSGGAKTPAKSNVEKTADLNNCFRAKGEAKTTFVSLDLVARGDKFLKGLMEKVRNVSSPLDPYETDAEQSFGYVRHEGLTAQWSIDYYDANGENESSDPSEESKTSRTLTLSRE